MKWIWELLWNNPVVVIGIVTLVAVTLLQELTGPPEWLRIVLVLVVAVGGLLTARATVSPTETYKERVPADI
jgi:hypothetical protein